MKCITSPALDDTQIMSYIEGEADDAVVAHIRECPYCKERASQWTLLQNRLKKQFYRVTCPTPMELGEYHLGLLPDPQKLAIAQHVRECPSCRKEVAILEDFLAESMAGDSLAGKAKTLMARLVGGHAGQPAHALTALRGETRGPLTFEADGAVIVLDVQPANDGTVRILGQLAVENQDQWTGAKVELQQADSSQLSASMDDLGAFHFEGIHPGAIWIMIQSLSDVQIDIPNIDVAM